MRTAAEMQAQAMPRAKRGWRLARAGLLAGAALLGLALPAVARERLYYIAADELDWNYLPLGRDGMMDMPAMGYAKFFLTRGPHLIGPVYHKAVYHEYTDASFTHIKQRSADDAYLGILGPVIHAEVGDTIRIVFRNNGTHPYSLHPHGVLYTKANEGAPYDDGVADADKPGDAVDPGKTYTYVWQVPERAGPGPRDPSSVVWLYHSHVDERRDTNSGLAGVIVVTRRGMARPDGTPRDVDREVVQFYMTYDENRSWFLDENIKRFTGDPVHTDPSKNNSIDPDGHYDPLIGGGLGTQNIRFTINGFQFSNMPAVSMHRGARVRWYLVTLGEGLNFHTPHWHGNTVLVSGQRTDVIALSPAQMVTADMQPDAPGLWMTHCHVSEHMEAGMAAMYRVLP